MNKVAEITLTSDAPGASMFMLGNEAIARGAIEAGVQVVAAYPGTPSSEITETLVNNAKNTGMYAEWSINEKVALEVAMAAAISGLRSLAIMKHVGVNVAHDALMSASYMGAGRAGADFRRRPRPVELPERAGQPLYRPAGLHTGTGAVLRPGSQGHDGGRLPPFRGVRPDVHAALGDAHRPCPQRCRFRGHRGGQKDRRSS